MQPFLFALTLLLAVPLHAFDWTHPATNGMENLDAFLTTHRESLDLPGLAAAVVRGPKIVAAGASGLRKAGDTEQVTIADRFHVGSCTKSMTALLAVLLSAEGRIQLTDTVGKILPDWSVPAGVRDITLDMLLQNQSGLGNNPNPDLWRRAFDEPRGQPREQRREFLLEFLQCETEAEPGTKYIYSNIGYALAGAMLERAAQRPWEELVRDRIFKPLRLSSGGFGPSYSADSLDQPWGHVWKDEAAVVVPPSDNPAAIAPGGAAHMSVLDLARYAALHLAIARGEVPRLRSYRKQLYSPPKGSSYALGWMAVDRDWAGGKALTHAGSNTMFFAVIWIAPAKDFAVVVTTNVGDRDDVIFNKCDQVVASLIERFLE